jgi:hypothetical protein
VPDRAEIDGEELAQEGRLDEIPVVHERAVLGEGERAQPATVAAVAVDDHQLAEPRAQAADDLARQLDQELRLERDGDPEPHVMRAEPGPDGGRDDRVGAGEASRAQRHRLDQHRVGADRQVLTVLLERAYGQHADGTGPAPLGRLGPRQLAEPVAAHGRVARKTLT